MKPRRFRTPLAAAIVASLPALTHVSAATYTWGVSGTGGTGSWDAATADWYTGSFNVAWADNNTASFGGTAGTVTLSGTQTVAGLTDSVAGYTITGGVLSTGTNNATFTLPNDLAIASILVGSGTFTKAGAGALTLSGNNAFTGPTTVSAGSLILSGSNTAFTGAIAVTSTLQLVGNSGNGGSTVGGTNASIGGSSALTLNNLSTLQLRADNNTTFAPASATLGTSAVTVNVNVGPVGSATGNTLTLANVASSSATTFNLTGTNGYNLQMGSGASGTGAVTLTAGATFNSNTAGVTLQIPGGFATVGTSNYSFTFGGAGNISVGSFSQGGTGTISPTFNSTGTVTLTGANNFYAATVQNSGTLVLNPTSSLYPQNTLTLGTGNPTIDNETGGPITFGANRVTLSGSGFIYTGGNPGTLNIGASTPSGGLSANTTITVNGASALTIQNGGLPLSGTFGLTKAGTGTLALTGSQTYTGATSVSAGTLTLTGTLFSNDVTVSSTAYLAGKGGIAASGTGSLTFNSGATLRVDATNPATALTVGSGATGNLTLNATTNVILDGVPATPGTGTVIHLIKYYGTETGAAGNLALQNAATFRNPTFSIDTTNKYVNLTIDTKASTWSGASGAWDIATSSNWNSGADKFYQGDAVTFDNTGTTKTVTITGTVIAPTVTFTNTSGNNYSIGGAGGIGGMTSLLKQGTGLVTITAPMTYSGTTSVTSGTLAISGSGTLGGGAAPLAMGGGTVDLGGGTAKVGAVTITASGSNIIQNGNLTATSYAGTNTTGTALVTANLLGVAATLSKSGAGTLTLSGSNSYTGVTTVSAGTLQFAKTTTLYGGVTSSWIASNLVVNNGYTAAFNVGGTGEFAASDIAALAALGNAGNGFRSGAIIGLDTTNAAGGVFTYGSVLANPNGGANTLGLTKLGSNTLTLTASNSYTGGTTVTGGTLNLANPNATGTGGTVTLSGGAISFDSSVAGNAFTFGSLAAAASTSTLALQNSAGVPVALTVGGNNAAFITYAGVLSGSGSVTKTGTTAWTLSSNASTFSGGLTVLTGQLTIGVGVGGSTLGSGTLILGDSTGVSTTPVTLSSGENYTYSNPIAVVGVNQVNTIVDTGRTGSFSGLITFSNASLILNDACGAAQTFSGGISGTGNLIVISSGSGGSVTLSGTVNNTGTITNSGTGYTPTAISAVIGSNVTGVAQSSTNCKLTLSGSNSYGGGTTLSSGTLNYSNGYALGTGTATFTGNATLQAGVTGTVANNIAIASGMTGTFDNQTYAATLSGIVSGSGALTKIGTGALVLIAANSYTGATTVSTGTLQLGDGTGGHDGSLATSAITNSGALIYNLSGSQTAGYLISGTGSLTKSGMGSLFLTASNSYTGATTVSAGMLSVSATNNLGAAAANLVLSGGTLQITGTTLTNFSGIGHTVSFTAAQPVALDIANAANTFTADQSLNQTTGGLTKSGSGTLILSASNSYTGATTVTGGTLQIGNGTTGSLATSSTVTVNAGATLAVNLANSGTFSSPIYTGLGGSAVNSMSSGTTTFSNNIYSGGSFNQTGAGTTILLGNNVSFYGPTNITAGVLQLSGSYAASITTVNVGVDNGLSFGVNAITIGGLSGTGAVALLNGTNGVALTVGNNNQDSTYSGAISGTNSGASFIKSGSGTLTLTGSSTYTVPTTISSGTLQLGDGTSGHDGALSTSAVTDNGTLGYNLSGSQTPSYLISGSGGLTKSGSGTLILTGSNTFTGVTLVNAGTLLLSATAGTTSYGIGKSTFDTSGAGTLSFGGMTAATFGGLQGAGNLVLSNTAGAAVALTVGANNQNTLYSGTLSGPGSLTKSGSGSLTMAAPYTLSILALDGAGSLAFQNNVTVSNLTLQNTSGVNTTTGAITVAAGKTLTIGGPSVSAPLTVASGSIAGVTNTVSISGATVGTGALAVTGTSMTLGNSYAITSDEYDTLNLSGLGSFTANVTNLQVGYLSNSSASRSSRGSLILAATNTITATTLSVGCATGSYNPSAVGLLELGSVNTFNVGTLNIGTGSKPASLLMFNPALGSPGTLVLRGTAGGSTTTTMAIDAANWTSSASYHQQADFTGGILDAKFGNVTVGSDLGNQNTHSSCLAIGQTTGAGADFSGGLLTIGQWAGSSYGSNVYDTMIPASFYIGTSSGSATMTSGTIKLANNTSASNVTVGPTVSGTVNPLPGTFVSGILTVGQNASVTASSIMLGLSGTGIASTNATVNLNNGGALTIQAGGIYTAQYAGASPATSTLSFDGGTLRASSSGSLVGSGSGALTSVTVLSGGATIDSNGNNVSIDQPLSAGVGNGLSSIAVTGSGSSWATAPYVQITDATGTGASAFAKIDGAGHVTSIFVTNRGQNYTSPTITLLSGGGNGVTLSSTMAPVTGGGLTKTGAGTLTLSASNGYTGATAINAGTLNLANANALAGGGNLTFGGGTLQYSATNQADYSARIANSGSAISIDTNGQTVSFASSLASSNTGGLTKLGAGTLALSAANNYRGGTTVTSGSLQIGNANALGTGGLTVNGGTFDLAGNSVSVPAFSGAGGNVTNSVSGTSTLTANTSGTATYNGNIADGAGSVVLTNSGAGTLILGGSLTMTGLNASNGVTQLTQSGSIGAVNVAAGATLSMAANSSGIRNVLSISSLTISGFTSTLASANNAAVNSAAYTSVASSAQSPNAGVLTDTGVSLTQAAAATATAPASPEAVPEPGTLGLLMAGAISLLRRRAGKKTL